MSKFQVQAHELVMSRDQKSAFADSFIFEPENIEEQALGNLYIIGEVTNFSENSSYLINLLISIVKREYYANSKRSPLDGLEAALHKANSTLADFAEQGNIEWINNLNITIAVLKDQELHFSQTGHCCVLLVRNGEIANISHGLTPEQASNHLKTFANIASGQLELDDQLVLATESFLSIVPESDIKKISKLGFGEKIKELEKVVRSSKESVESASIIVLKISDSKETVKKLNHIEIPGNVNAPFGIEEKAQNTAMRDFALGKHNNVYGNEIENTDAPGRMYETEDDGKLDNAKAAVSGILKNSIVKIFKYAKIAVLKFADYAAIAFAKLVEFLKTKLIPSFKKTGGLAVKGVMNKISNNKEIKEETLDNSLDETVEPSRSLSEISDSSVPEQHIIKEEADFVQNETFNEESPAKFSLGFKKRFKPLKFNYLLRFINAKTVLVLAVVVLAVYTASVVVVVKDQKNSEQDTLLYGNILKEAVQKKEAAELAFIYKDDNKAKSLLRDAQASLSKIYTSGYLKDEAVKELSYINGIIEKLDKITVLADPSIASDLTSVDSAANANRLLISDNIIYLYGGSKNSIYSYDMSKGALSEIKANYTNVGNLKMGAVSSDKKIILYHDAPGIAIYDAKKNEIKPADIALPQNNPVIKDIIAFDAYFYILDSANEQIIKYKRTTGGFSEGKDWIAQKGENSLAKSTSIAVDGSLYILDDDGKIYKYYVGAPKDFKQYALFNAIGAGGKITTKTSFKNLYVLDPVNKRMVVFDKEGNLIKQIKSDKFDSLKDMAVIDEKSAYILNGTKIYKVEL